jgi:protein ImuA
MRRIVSVPVESSFAGDLKPLGGKGKAICTLENKSRTWQTAAMDLTRLTRASYRQDRPSVPLLGRFRLAGARAHEFCGPARRRLALWLAQETRGPILWIRPAWHPDRLHMAGVREEVDPGRLVFVDPTRPEDMLWATEETLRAGIVSLVVADLPEPPGLTPVRRLHLAAEAGAETSGRAPLGLLLTPGDGGAPGVETRWRLDPAHEAPDGPGWHLARLRAREAPPGDWRIRRGPTGMPEIAPLAQPHPA